MLPYNFLSLQVNTFSVFLAVFINFCHFLNYNKYVDPEIKKKRNQLSTYGQQAKEIRKKLKNPKNQLVATYLASDNEPWHLTWPVTVIQDHAAHAQRPPYVCAAFCDGDRTQHSFC